MDRDTILIITAQDRLRGLFQQGNEKQSTLVFARDGTEARHILSRQAMTAVISDNQVSPGRGADILRWVHEKDPSIPLILLGENGSTDFGEDKLISRFVHMIPAPTSLEEVKPILALCLRGAAKSSAESIEEMEFSNFPAENADQQIIRGIIEFIDQLTPLPMIIQRILQLMDQEETSTRELAEVISLDTALAARVLKLVNSSMYGLANEVTTIQRAVSILGFSDLRSVALGLKMMDAFAKADDGKMDRDAFWEHSLACGFCAQSLSEKLRKVFPEEAFLGGLFHDVGKLVLDSYLPDQWTAVQHQARTERRPPLTVEEKVIGVPHTAVGLWLAQRWKLPRLHQIAIKYHHEIPPEGKYTPQERVHSAIICAANCLVHWLDLGTSGYSPLRVLTEEISGLLGLSDPILEQALVKTIWEVSKWKEALGLQDGKVSVSDLDSESLNSESDTSPEKNRVFVVAPQKHRIPSLKNLFATLGYEVHPLQWGDKLLEFLPGSPHQAIIMELEKPPSDTEQLLGFLRATRSRTSAPILLITRQALKLPPAKDLRGIYLIRGVPHRGAIEKVLKKVLAAKRS